MTLAQIAEASGINYSVVLQDVRKGKLQARKDPEGHWKVSEGRHFIDWLIEKWDKGRVEMYHPARAVRRAYDFGYIAPYHCGKCDQTAAEWI